MCWHKWAKWKVTEKGTLTAEYDALTGRKLMPDEKYINGSFIKQQRECEKCGKIQIRRARDIA